MLLRMPFNNLILNSDMSCIYMAWCVCVCVGGGGGGPLRYQQCFCFVTCGTGGHREVAAL